MKKEQQRAAGMSTNWQPGSNEIEREEGSSHGIAWNGMIDYDERAGRRELRPLLGLTVSTPRLQILADSAESHARLPRRLSGGPLELIVPYFNQ
jgi:hypothetical protein